jgi:hypothetical protein
MSIKWSIELYVRTHNNREESYIVPEKLVSHIAIFLRTQKCQVREENRKKKKKKKKMKDKEKK